MSAADSDRRRRRPMFAGTLTPPPARRPSRPARRPSRRIGAGSCRPMPQAQRGQDVRTRNPLALSQVGDRPRHAEHPLAAAGAERAHRVGRARAPRPAAVSSRTCRRTSRPSISPLQRAAVPASLSAGAPAPRRRGARACAESVVGPARSSCSLGRADAHQQVHPIEQRAAQPPMVPAQVRLAAAAAIPDAGEPARARVGGRDEHEAGREHERALAADDRHRSRPRAAGAAPRGSSAGTPRARRGTGRRGWRASPRPGAAASLRRPARPAEIV